MDPITPVATPVAAAPGRSGRALTRRRSRGAIIIGTSLGAVILATVSGCQALGLRGPSRPDQNLAAVGSVERERPFLILVLDTSSSMDITDSNRFAVQGAQLAVALAADGDNVGVVSFDSQARVIASCNSLSTAARRREASVAIANLWNWGKTNFAGALRRANAMLEEAEAPPGTDVIFLTDGRLKRGQPEDPVLAELRQIRDQGARIHAVALSEGGRSELLQRMATATGGSFRYVETADQLLDTFIELIAEVRGLLVRRGPLVPVELFAGTRRLAFALTREDGASGIERIVHDGRALDAGGDEPSVAGFYRYPEAPVEGQPALDDASVIEVANLDGPAAGRWTVETRGTVAKSVVLQEPGFRVRLEGPSGDLYENDTEVPLTLIIEADDPAAIAPLGARARGEAELASAESDAVFATGALTVRPGADGGTRVVLSGSVPLQGASAPDTLTATARLRIAGPDGGEAWTLSRSLSLRLLEGERPHTLTVDPERLDLGPLWGDGAEVRQTITLGTRAEEGLVVDVSGPTGELSPLAVENGGVEISSGGTVEVTVAAAPARASATGDHADRVVLTWRAPDVDEPIETVVPISVTIVGVQIANEALSAKPGQTVTWPLARVVTTPPQPWRDGPPAEIVLTSGDGSEVRLALEGDAPGEGEAAIEDTRAYVGAVSADAASGSYRGSLALTLGDLPERSVEIALKVEPRPLDLACAPATLSVAGGAGGWLRLPLAVTVQSKGDAQIELRPSALTRKGGRDRDAIAPPYDVRVKRLQGFDGEGALAPGAAGRLELSVYVSSDLPSGVYEGSLLVVATDGGRRSEQRLPVRVEVKR